jgi:hypothetical protein
MAEQTEGTIENPISPPDLSDRTRIVLTNAIRFKGQCTAPFGNGNSRAARVFSSPFCRASVTAAVRDPQGRLISRVHRNCLGQFTLKDAEGNQLIFIVSNRSSTSSVAEAGMMAAAAADGIGGTIRLILRISPGLS